MKKTLAIIFIGVTALVSLATYILYQSYFGAPNPREQTESTFIVPKNQNDDAISKKLQEQGFIKSAKALSIIKKLKKYSEIKPGGYNLLKNQDAWATAREIYTEPPDMKWITIPEGIRKEQIAEIMARDLGWTTEEVRDWNKIYTRTEVEYLEGTYFPDTYLIPVSEKNFEVANRLRRRFNEKFAPYVNKFTAKNILWTTGLKVASLIERETADPKDMPLISGIIWNRLNIGMRLQIDATLQYAKGKVGDKWWSSVSSEDKYIDSPYNTYSNKGLPPTPICNPGLDAIEAALNPTETDCLFYLHAKDGTMYCSVTYDEHLQNIDKYL